LDEARDRIGSLLTGEKLVSTATLARAVEIQRQSGGRLGEILMAMGAISPQQFYRVLAKQLSVPFCDLRATDPDPGALKLFTVADARQLRAIPLYVKGNILHVAVEDPSNITKLETIRARTGYPAAPCLAIPEEIENAIHRYYELPSDFERAERRLRSDKKPEVPRDGGGALIAEVAQATAEEAPIVNLVDSIIREAARRGASDIHIEPFQDITRVKYRVDGVLEEASTSPRSIHEGIVTRLKVLGGLDIAEKRVPQDGRFSVTIDDRPYDLRLSSLPTIFGEKIVIRLLEQSKEYTSLDKIGLSDSVLSTLKKALAMPYGMILIAGPTGSGKSTTLAAALRQINSPGKNVVTVEDPVEYVIPGVNHTQVNIKAGLNFATVVRHILRQDPDVIMIGEIRDLETTEMALRASLTGHLVLATIHANDAISALMRLEEMGVNRYMALSSLTALYSQRLVRTLCPWCKKPWNPPDEVLDEVLRAAGVKRDQVTIDVYSSSSCDSCFAKGFKGRTAISEIVLVDEDFRKRYMETSDPRSDPALNPAKRRRGMLSDGALKVLRGITTWEEVLRVFGGENVQGG